MPIIQRKQILKTPIHWLRGFVVSHGLSIRSGCWKPNSPTETLEKGQVRDEASSSSSWVMLFFFERHLNCLGREFVVVVSGKNRQTVVLQARGWWEVFCLRISSASLDHNKKEQHQPWDWEGISATRTRSFEPCHIQQLVRFSLRQHRSCHHMPQASTLLCTWRPPALHSVASQSPPQTSLFWDWIPQCGCWSVCHLGFSVQQQQEHALHKTAHRDHHAYLEGVHALLSTHLCAHCRLSSPPCWDHQFQEQHNTESLWQKLSCASPTEGNEEEDNLLPANNPAVSQTHVCSPHSVSVWQSAYMPFDLGQPPCV